MAVRKVVQIGHPALKAKNKVLSSFKSTRLKKLLKDLKETMYRTGLIGIAAPQIGENYMVFVTHTRTTKARKLGKEDLVRIYINPKIIYSSKTRSQIYKGCGSVANGAIFGPVSRSKELQIKAHNEKGQLFTLKCDGILARVIQHEMDHLMGIEFIQKVDDYKEVIVEEYYRKTIRNSKNQLSASKITKIEYKKINPAANSETPLKTGSL